MFLFTMFYLFAISMTRTSEIEELSFVFLCVSSLFPRNGVAAYLFEMEACGKCWLPEPLLRLARGSYDFPCASVELCK